MTSAEFIYTVLLKKPPLRRAVNRVILSLLPKTVRIHNARIWLNKKDPVVSGALLFRVYERDEIRFFRACFRSDMNFVDVGANVGLYTGLALSTPGFSGTILCLEPHAESRYFLEQTIKSNTPAGQVRAGNPVMVCSLAADNKKASLALYKNPQNRGDNRIYPDPLLRQAEMVQTDTLDSLCEMYGLQGIDLLKIDVQGAEARVISGARQILARSSTCILMTEFWPYGLSKSGSDADHYLDDLQGLGFSLYELHRHRLTPVEPRSLIQRTFSRRYANIVGFKGSPEIPRGFIR